MCLSDFQFLPRRINIVVFIPLMFHSESESIVVCESEPPTMLFASVQWGWGDFLFILSYDWSNPQHTISFEPMRRVGVHVVRFPEPLKGGFAASQRGYFRSRLFEITHSWSSEACAKVMVKSKIFWSPLVTKKVLGTTGSCNYCCYSKQDTEPWACVHFISEMFQQFYLSLLFANNS